MSFIILCQREDIYSVTCVIFEIIQAKYSEVNNNLHFFEKDARNLLTNI